MKLRKIFASFLFGALLFSASGISVSVASTGDFSDVPQYNLFFKSVDYLKNEGIVVGYSDGTYGVDKNINRAEFLKIVMEAGDYMAEGSNCFPDVKNEWFAPYVCTAYDLGLVDGYPDGTFKPGDEINFVEASKIVVNALDLENVETDGPWFETFVLALEDTESIPANVDNFDENLTRGEMAEMIWRIDADVTYKISNTYQNISAGQAIDERASELSTFSSCVELESYIENNADSSDYYYSGFVDDAVMLDMAEESVVKESAAAPSAEASVTAGGGGADDYSSTNVQVEGVDEADIIKNDDKYIYLIKDDTVRIVDAYLPSGMKELDQVAFGDSSFYPYEMYVDDDRMVVVGESYAPVFSDMRMAEYNYYGTTVTRVYILDISDRSDVEVLRDLSFEGSYSSSRKVDGTVYLVSNKYNYLWGWDFDNSDGEELLPLYSDSSTGDIKSAVSCSDVKYMPAVTDSVNYLIVSAIDINDADSDIGEEVIVGSSGEIYASTDNLYVAEPKYNYSWWYEDSGDSEETYVHKFALDGTDLEYKGMGKVPGTILNQFSMDENGNYFRIATTKGWWEGSENNMYVLDSDLNVVGSVEGLAPGEQIHSVRFIGDRAYMVTFEQIDPLFVLDLSSPTNPKVLGELKIPGVSDYLHPFGENYLIGFGLDTVDPEVIAEMGWSWFQGIKMSMFDVSDVSNPVELHKMVIGDRGTTSELLYNHKALLFDEDKGMMAFPVAIAEIPQNVKDNLDVDSWVYGDYVFQGAYVYDVSVEDGFKLRGTISHYDEDELGNDFEYYYYYGISKDIERILYIGNYFYTVSSAVVQANGMGTLQEVNSVALAE